MSNRPSTGAGPARVREPLDPEVPALVHEAWRSSFPWLVQGTTTRGRGLAFDLGLFAGASPEDVVRGHWDGLMARTGMGRAVHARQVHEAHVRVHRAVTPGLVLTPECDGHATDQADVLVAVATADCVPIFVVAPEAHAVAVLHAGWRGAAAGVLERGLRVFEDAFGARPSELQVHFGPAICGECYEVGAEVFEALGQGVPAGPTPIDLRAVLAERAMAYGVVASGVTISEHCTRCTGSELFSHRGGDGARQVGYLGMRS